MAITTLCARCGINEVPVPESIEEDPVCSACRRAMFIGHTVEGVEVTFALIDGPRCQGWGEDCGTILMPGEDLCPDCTMGRMNQQSPRPNL